MSLANVTDPGSIRDDRVSLAIVADPGTFREDTNNRILYGVLYYTDYICVPSHM